MRRTIGAAACALALSACDGAPTGPTAQTRIEARVQDSPGQSSVSGTFAGNFFASVWDGDRWVDLGTPNGITVPVQQSGASTVHGEQSAPTGSYSRARLVLQGVTARVARGSVVGGITLANDATVTLGGSDQRVELTASVDSFALRDDPSTRRVVVFDLRSAVWLSGAVVQAGLVEDSTLQAAVSASTRTESR